MDNNKMQSGFKVNNLLLIESKFNRINQVQFDDTLPDLVINTDVNVSDDKIINVIETVTLVKKSHDIEQYSFSVKMVGIFECIGDSEIKDFDSFGKVNGAAIIFPYIREHITSLSLKAGLGPIILPPVNFTNNLKIETDSPIVSE